MITICDTAPLVASLDPRDRNYVRSSELLRRPDFDLVVPSLVVAEVCYFAAKYFGADVEATFLHDLQSFTVEAPTRDDWPLIANLVERYSDFPLGGTDASVAVLAERLGTDLIITLDRRHFGALRMSDGRPFTLLPD